MCIAKYHQQISLTIAAMKLKYISDCQVIYKEDERERVSEIKSVTVFRCAYKKRWKAGDIIPASLTSDIPSKSSWGPGRELN